MLKISNSLAFMLLIRLFMLARQMLQIASFSNLPGVYVLKNSQLLLLASVKNWSFIAFSIWGNLSPWLIPFFFFFAYFIGSVSVYVGLSCLQEGVCNIWSIHVPITTATLNNNADYDCDSLEHWWNYFAISMYCYCAKVWEAQRPYSSLKHCMFFKEWWKTFGGWGKLEYLYFQGSVSCILWQIFLHIFMLQFASEP